MCFRECASLTLCVLELFSEVLVILSQYCLLEAPPAKKENKKPRINLAFQTWIGSKLNLQFTRQKRFSSAVIQCTFGLFEDSRMIAPFAHTSEYLSVVHACSGAVCFSFFLVFLWLRGKWWPLTSRPSTWGQYSHHLHLPSPASQRLQVTFCFNSPLQ